MTTVEELEMLELEEEEAKAAHASTPGVPTSTPSSGSAALKGLGQGLTLGFGDELGAGIQSALSGFEPGVYTRARDENRAEDRAAKEAHPWIHGLGSVAGAIPSAFLVPGTGAAKGAGLLSRLGRTAAVGAGLGGVAGLGESEADSLGGYAKDVATGAGLGGLGAGVLGGAGEAVGAGLQGVGASRLPEALRSMAANRAAKAVGFIQKDLNKLPEGAGTDIGRTLLSRGLVKFGRTSEELAPGIKAARGAAGEDIGSIMRAADEASGGTGPQVRAQVAARRLADADKQAAQAAAFKNVEGGVDAQVAGAGEAQAARRAGIENQIEAKAQELAARREALEKQVQQGVEQARLNRLAPATSDASKVYRQIDQLPEKSQEAAIQGLVDKLHAPSAEEAPFHQISGMTGKQRAGAVSDLADQLEAAQSPRVDPTNPATYVGPQTKDLRAQHMADVAADLAPPADKSSFRQGLGFNLGNFTDKLRSEAIPEFSDPAFGNMGTALKRQLGRYEARADNGVSFSEANRMKQNIQKTISKFTDTPASQQSKLRLQSLLGDTIDSQVAERLGPDAAGRLTTANRDFGQFAEAAKAARGAERRNLGNNALSLTSRLAGLGGIGAGAGSLVGHPVLSGAAGIAAALGHQALHGRGASALAVGLHGAGNLLGSADAPAIAAALRRVSTPGAAFNRGAASSVLQPRVQALIAALRGSDANRQEVANASQ